MTLCQDAFANEAHFMARIMGLEEIRLAIVHRPRPGEPQDMDREPERVVRAFVAALTAPARVPVPARGRS